MKTEFKEVQRFGPLILSLLLLPAAVMVGVLIFQFFFQEPSSDTVVSNVILATILLLYILPITWCVVYARLTVIINHTGVYYGWNLPTAELNFLPWEKIKEMRIIQHKFVGYGYKFSRDYGIIYNTTGRTGLQLITHSGEKILLGTTRPEEMTETLRDVNKLKDEDISPSSAGTTTT